MCVLKTITYINKLTFDFNDQWSHHKTGPYKHISRRTLILGALGASCWRTDYIWIRRAPAASRCLIQSASRTTRRRRAPSNGYHGGTYTPGLDVNKSIVIVEVEVNVFSLRTFRKYGWKGEKRDVLQNSLKKFKPEVNNYWCATESVSQ